MEDVVAQQLLEAGVPFDYEKLIIEYARPARTSKYNPDFQLKANGIIVETKGRFLSADRQKHLLIKKQRPDLDIRFVFSNSRTKISKRSDTTYGMWCERHGFKYADGTIPPEWLEEPPKK